jgi:hypothetical protein
MSIRTQLLKFEGNEISFKMTDVLIHNKYFLPMSYLYCNNVITIILRHYLGLDRPVSASSNILF